MDTSKDIRKETEKILYDKFVTKVIPRGMKDNKMAEVMTKYLAHETGVMKDVDEAVDSILQVFKEYIEEKKGEDGLRLDNFKEGYKTGYNKALNDCLEGLEKEVEPK